MTEFEEKALELLRQIEDHLAGINRTLSDVAVYPGKDLEVLAFRTVASEE